MACLLFILYHLAVIKPACRPELTPDLWGSVIGLNVTLRCVKQTMSLVWLVRSLCVTLSLFVAYIFSPYLQDAKPEVAEKPVKPVVELAEPVDAEQADAVNGELSQPEDSDESSQFATPFESEEFERPLPDDGRKRYSNTFLLSIAPLCKDLPPQIEMATLSALQWVEGMGEKPLAPPRKF